MAMGNSQSLTPQDFEAIKSLAQDYNISKIEQKYQQVYDHRPLYEYSRRADSVYDYTTEHRVISMFSLEITDRALAEIATKIQAYEDLMEDPETRNMVREAMFIRRLKRGM